MKESIKPYLLYVGNLYPHKNIKRLISAFRQLIEKDNLDYRLVIVGGDKKNSTERIIFTGLINDEELDDIYKNASLFVFPSLSEGFGFPPLEAMKRGVPVVSSHATCLPEILGNAAVYFNPQDVSDMAEKIKKVLLDKNLKSELIKKGLEGVKKYDWQKTAEETLTLYKNIP